MVTRRIREKLRNFKSTESALPAMSSTDITIKRSDTVRYSPLPAWLECMTKSWLKSKQILYTSVPVAYRRHFPENQIKYLLSIPKRGWKIQFRNINRSKSKIKDIFSDATPILKEIPFLYFNN